MQINELFCIGCNKYGQSGAGRKYHTKIFKNPKSIIFPIFIKQVVCGVNHSALLTIDGKVYTMGSNMHGTLAQLPSALSYSYSPVLVSSLDNISKISSGSYHMCAINNGKMYSWGKGLDGQLGTGTFTNSHIPTQLKDFADQVDEVSCGTNHTLVKTVNNKCYAFGNGIYGQLGVGNNKNYNYPTLVNIDNINQIAAGQNYSLFLRGQEVYGVGDNSKNQISASIKKKCLLMPQSLGIKGITMIRAHKYSVACSNSQKLLIWGFNSGSQIQKIDAQDLDVMDIKTAGDHIYFSTANGQFHRITKKQNKFVNQKIDVNTEAIMDFDVGERHTLILGDIIGEINQPQSSQDILYTIEELEAQKILQQNYPSHKNSSNSSHKSSQNSLSQVSACSVSSDQSINSEHLSRTPSSIMREPSSFLKQQKSKPEINVSDFGKDTKSRISAPPLQQCPSSRIDTVQYSQCMEKIDEILTLLDRNAKIVDNPQNTSRSFSRIKTKRNLQPSIEEKQNKVATNRQKKTQNNNKLLIMELREKQLKISQLQEKLSQREVQIQCQKKVIDMLRNFNRQQQ